MAGYLGAKQSATQIDGYTKEAADAQFVDNDELAAAIASVDVTAQVQAIVDAAPEQLNTLNELAAALNDDANFGSTVTSAITSLDNGLTAEATARINGDNALQADVDAKMPITGGRFLGHVNVASDNTYFYTGNAGSGKTVTIGNTATSDSTPTLDYRAYMGYDTYYDANAGGWKALRPSLGNKWVQQFSYHTQDYRIRAYTGDVTSTWADTAWTDLLTVQLGGKVGLNTNDPKAHLHIKSGDGVRSLPRGNVTNQFFENSTDQYIEYCVPSTATTNGFLFSSEASPYGLINYNTADQQFQFYTSSSLGPVIDSDGDIVLQGNNNVKKELPSWHPHTGTAEGTKVNAPSATVKQTIDAWEQIAYIGMSQGNPGLLYRHVKLSYASTSAMMYFWLHGYGYNRGNTDTKIGLYMYTGTNILNKYINNSGNATVFHNAYKAADGKLVLVINIGSTAYTSAAAQLYVRGHGDQFNASKVSIESICSSSSAGAQY
jgi:hypothetical protein